MPVESSEKQITQPVMDQCRYEARAQVLKALAHPTRLWLVDRLQHQSEPLCVCDLMEGIDADMSTVSKHLSLLRQAGIVSSYRQGKKIFYRLEVPCLSGLMTCVEGVINQEQNS